MIMTVLTQLSVGAFTTIWLLQLLGASSRLGLAAIASLLLVPSRWVRQRCTSVGPSTLIGH